MDGNFFLIILVIFSFICLGFTIYCLWQENKVLRTDNKDLLNRLMAKNYVEYAQVELAKSVQEQEKEQPKQSFLQDRDIYPVD